MLKVGEQVPDFTAMIQDGSTITLSGLRGQKLVIYFYPADNTPSCTAEGCSLRDHNRDLMKKGYKIYGVSPDSAKKHTNFIKKFEFPFDLIVDKDLQITKSFGAWGWKKFMGKEYEGVLRSTFLIDEHGVVEAVISKVKSKTHGEQVLDVIDSLIEV